MKNFLQWLWVTLGKQKKYTIANDKRVGRNYIAIIRFSI